MSKFKVGDKVRVNPRVVDDSSAGEEGVIDRVLPEGTGYDYTLTGSHFGFGLGWAFRDRELEHLLTEDPDEEVDPLYGDKPWIPEERPTGTLAEAYAVMHRSAYLDELRVRRNRIHDGLFAVSQVDIATPEVMRELAKLRDYVDAQIEHEKEKFNV